MSSSDVSVNTFYKCVQHVLQSSARQMYLEDIVKAKYNIIVVYSNRIKFLTSVVRIQFK